MQFHRLAKARDRNFWSVRAGSDIRLIVHRTADSLLAVVDRERLLDDKPFLQTSIRLRNPYVDPLHAIQIRLLREHRAAADPERRAALEHPLLLTISGIAAGLRNPG